MTATLIGKYRRSEYVDCAGYLAPKVRVLHEIALPPAVGKGSGIEESVQRGVHVETVGKDGGGTAMGHVVADVLNAEYDENVGEDSGSGVCSRGYGTACGRHGAVRCAERWTSGAGGAFEGEQRARRQRPTCDCNDDRALPHLWLMLLQLGSKGV